MAAERIDRVEVMEASLRKLIGLRPDHAHAYNALGYSLADRNLRLDEAQALIEKALELSPNDGHILDSMGWVLFRKGQYERAIQYLRRAFEIMPDAEVAAHLGEALWQAGKTDEAKQLWRDARRKDPDNQALQQTLNRLKVQL
jgi:Flp pilus assembly protein TadD